VRLIVFDCDGTLVDSQHLIVEAMGAAFAANGLPAPARSQVLRHIGLSVSEAVAGIGESQDEALIASLAAAYKTAFSGLRQRPSFAEPFFPGAREAVEELARDASVVLGIATGKSRRGVDLLLQREQLAYAFATLQTADDAPSKPHPEMLLRAMSETGVGPADTIMIGDTSYDMAMARNAGVLAIGVAWGYHTAQELTEAGALAVAEDCDQLMALLARPKAVAAE
jgi:phosphoglycolate phosphatase